MRGRKSQATASFILRVIRGGGGTYQLGSVPWTKLIESPYGAGSICMYTAGTGSVVSKKRETRAWPNSR